MEVNIFEVIKSIYLKTPLELESNVSLNITISKFLSYDKDNLKHLKEIVPFIFDVEPNTYLNILWLSIPYKSKVPFLKNVSQIKVKEEELFQVIADFLEWSPKELELNRDELIKKILPRKEYWKKEMGIN
jgi:hypothetical protein